jgi:hypothetical protein
VENEPAIAFVNLAQQTAKLVEIAGSLAGATPSDVVGRLPLQEVRQFGRLLTVIEKLVQRNFQGRS